ncbi:MAG: sugar phosphate isomerase/epimerase family protein [Aurantibacter sp.]
MKRKDFLQQMGLLSAASTLGIEQLFASSLDEPSFATIDKIGIQLFSLPALLEKDFEGGVAMLTKMGYTELELFGPFEFSTEKAKARWNAITPQLGFSGCGYFGRSADEVKSIFKEHSMSVPSIHTDLDTMETDMEAFAKASEVLGFEYITLPAIPEERRATMDGYKKMADTFNGIGENARKFGLKLAYHNHGYGLREVNGEVPFEVMVDLTDPNLVFLEMDIFWTTAGRADPIDYLKKYSGRYHMMHLKDMKPITYFSGDGSDPPQWMELFPKMTTAGDGDIDLHSIVKTAKENGVKHFFVEQDIVQQPEIALKRSIDYLKTV